MKPFVIIGAFSMFTWSMCLKAHAVVSRDKTMA
jgi:hypothetical protein